MKSRPPARPTRERIPLDYHSSKAIRYSNVKVLQRPMPSFTKELKGDCLEPYTRHDTLGGTMKSFKSDPDISGKIVMLILVTLAAAIVGVLYGTAASAKGEPAEPTRTVIRTEHVLDRNEVDVPSVPTECLLALEEADKAFSQADRLTNSGSLTREDKRDIKGYLDRISSGYQQNKEACEEMAH